jgi:hypothetical protein
MRNISVLFVLAFALAWAPFAQAQLSFDADFGQDGAYETSWPMKAGDVVSVDIYVSNVPSPGLIAMGFKLTYDPEKLSVEGAGVDEVNWPYPFAGGFLDLSIAGEIVMAGLRVLEGPAGDHIRLGTVTFRCITEGTSAFMMLDREGDWFVLDSEEEIVLDGDIGAGVLLATIRPLISGDVNGDGLVNLADAIAVLKVMAQVGQGEVVHTTGDVNGDGLIGTQEVIYILQRVSGLQE